MPGEITRSIELTAGRVLQGQEHIDSKSVKPIGADDAKFVAVEFGTDH